jgi:glycosyltransferase involved in cell wall biosynthesis
MSYRAVGVIGDPNDINCWSNIPYFFLDAGQRAGFFHLGLKVEPKREKLARSLWNVANVMRGDRTGGFQYTRYFNEAMLNQTDTSEISEIVSHFQLFPPYELCQKKGIAFSPYIDFPLPCLFDDYDIASTIGDRIMHTALAREREQYAAAKYVICMSPWAAQQVIDRCEVPAHKVHAIIPGANLPASMFSDPSNAEDIPLGEPPDGKNVPLRIAFVGKVPLRKGLDRLVAGVRILRSQGYKIVVRVIGSTENLFPHDPEVENLGFINKLHQPLRLVEELQSCHIGALPSYQEAFGIAALEYLRCGLPAIVTKTGGLGDSIPPDCGIVLAADCTGADIADAIANLLDHPDQFQQLRQNARQKAAFASWDRTIRDFQQLWSQS